MPAGIGQAQLDALFTAALEAAIGRLEKDGHFQPLLFELRAGGAIHNVAVLDPGTLEGTQTVLDRLVALLRPRVAEGTVKAAAIAQHLSEFGAIEVRLRAPNYSGDVTIPFAMASSGVFKRKRELTLGDFVVRQVDNEVFQT